MDGYAYGVGYVALFDVGLVAHDFEEDLEFGEFAFVAQKQGMLCFPRHFINLNLTKIKQR